MPRIEKPLRFEGPVDHSDLRALRERVNRIDRADDIADWRREVQNIANELTFGAKTRSERINLTRKILLLAEKMH